MANEIKSYDPTLTDRVRWTVSDLLRGLGMSPGGAAHIGGTTADVLGMAPVTGNILAGSQLKQAHGYLEPALLALAAALPAGSGPAVKFAQSRAPEIEKAAMQMFDWDTFSGLGKGTSVFDAADIATGKKAYPVPRAPEINPDELKAALEASGPSTAVPQEDFDKLFAEIADLIGAPKTPEAKAIPSQGEWDEALQGMGVKEKSPVPPEVANIDFAQVPFLTGDSEADKILAPVWDQLHPEWQKFHIKNAHKTNSVKEAQDTVQDFHNEVPGIKAGDYQSPLEHPDEIVKQDRDGAFPHTSLDQTPYDPKHPYHGDSIFSPAEQDALDEMAELAAGLPPLKSKEKNFKPTGYPPADDKLAMIWDKMPDNVKLWLETNGPNAHPVDLMNSVDTFVANYGGDHVAQSFASKSLAPKTGVEKVDEKLAQHWDAISDDHKEWWTSLTPEQIANIGASGLDNEINYSINQAYKAATSGKPSYDSSKLLVHSPAESPKMTGNPEVDALLEPHWHKMSKINKEDILDLKTPEDQMDYATIVADYFDSKPDIITGNLAADHHLKKIWGELDDAQKKEQISWINSLATDAGKEKYAKQLVEDHAENAWQTTVDLNTPFPDRLASGFTPMDWKSQKNTNPGVRSDMLRFPDSEAMGRALDIGHNMDFTLFHGQKPEYPVSDVMYDPMKKQHEKAIFMSDNPKISARYADLPSGGVVNQYVTHGGNAAEIDWRAVTGSAGYSETEMRKLINEARKQGYDFVKIKNIYDIGGGPSGGGSLQDQFITLNTNILRDPGAAFDPAKKDVNNLFAGLAGGGVVLPLAGAGVGAASMATSTPAEASGGTEKLDPIIQQLKAAGIPLNVTSGYRDPKHNADVGGAKGSQHIHDNARDLSLKGLTEDQKKLVVQTIQANPNVGGFGYYPNSDSIHFDARTGGKAAWGSNYSKSSVGQGWPEWLTQSTNQWRGTPSATVTPSLPPTKNPSAFAPATGPATVATPTAAAPTLAPNPWPQAATQPSGGFDLGQLVKGLGQFAGAMAGPAQEPMFKMPDFAPALPAAPQQPVFDLLQKDPRLLASVLDPKGLFLGLR